MLHCIWQFSEIVRTHVKDTFHICCWKVHTEAVPYSHVILREHISPWKSGAPFGVWCAVLQVLLHAQKEYHKMDIWHCCKNSCCSNLLYVYHEIVNRKCIKNSLLLFAYFRLLFAANLYKAWVQLCCWLSKSVLYSICQKWDLGSTQFCGFSFSDRM